jgi:hypothetical protein
MLRKLKLTTMTDLQFGFTEGINPIMASLLISEAKYERKKKFLSALHLVKCPCFHLIHLPI